MTTSIILEHDDDTMMDKTSFRVQINRRKLFDQVFAADGSKSVLSNNHAVFLTVRNSVRDRGLFLSDKMQYMLPKITIAVTRPRNLASYARAEDCYENIDVALVYVKFDDISLTRSKRRSYHLEWRM